MEEKKEYNKLTSLCKLYTLALKQRFKDDFNLVKSVNNLPNYIRNFDKFKILTKYLSLEKADIIVSGFKTDKIIDKCKKCSKEDFLHYLQQTVDINNVYLNHYLEGAFRSMYSNKNYIDNTVYQNCKVLASKF